MWQKCMLKKKLLPKIKSIKLATFYRTKKDKGMYKLNAGYISDTAA